MKDPKTLDCSLKFRWAHEGIPPKFTIRTRALKKVRQPSNKRICGPQNRCGRFGNHIKV